MTATGAAVLRVSARHWGAARAVIAVLALVAILFLFVFPTRSFLAQRRAVADTRHDVEVIEEQNSRLEEELRLLRTPEEIERRAREQFHMVRPGERPFVVVPAPSAP